MKVVIAPDSFKESLTARQVAENLRDGLAAVWPDAEYVLVPMADGGEGTVQSLVDATGGRRMTVPVSDPLGRPVEASFGVLGGGDVAVLEMAAASGLELLEPGERDPLGASTYGTGQLITAALHTGTRRIIVGIGGSATNDGGAGMVQALGGRLVDASGADLSPGGAALAELAHIDLSGLPERLRAVEIVVACDVDNPLTGPRGASRVFGRQKGADPQMIEQLDAALGTLARVIRADLGVDIEDVPGAGAAGGLGGGLLAFLGADLQRGIDIVIEHTALVDAVAGADLVITGEGALDSQTRYGKTPAGVARVAKERGVPVVAVAGSVGDDAGALLGDVFDAIVPIVPGPCELADALAAGPANLRRAGEQIGRLLRLGGAPVGR
ncbi:glycerate kinase [Nigerium massiliense]|uniref:glycerate kinase n=1 Tax=Nigerium massiliense TaxID=1522317 RepID=UPI00058DE2B3|nr:glycerate kinase [Nigerium massiliense]